MYNSHQHADPVQSTLRLVVGGVARQIIPPTNIRRLFVLHRFQFRTLCNPVAKTAAIAATPLVWNENKNKRSMSRSKIEANKNFEK